MIVARHDLEHLFRRADAFGLEKASSSLAAPDIRRRGPVRLEISSDLPLRISKHRA